MVLKICGGGLRAVRGLQIPWNRKAISGFWTEARRQGDGASNPKDPDTDADRRANEPVGTEARSLVVGASHREDLDTDADRRANKLVDILNEHLRFSRTTSAGDTNELNFQVAAGIRPCDDSSDDDSEDVKPECERTVLNNILRDSSNRFKPEELQRYLSGFPAAALDQADLVNKAEEMSSGGDFSDGDSISDLSSESSSENGSASSASSSLECSPKATRTRVSHDFPDPSEYLKKRDVEKLRADIDSFGLIEGEDAVPAASTRCSCMELPTVCIRKPKDAKSSRTEADLVIKGNQYSAESNVSVRCDTAKVPAHRSTWARNLVVSRAQI